MAIVIITSLGTEMEVMEDRLLAVQHPSVHSIPPPIPDTLHTLQAKPALAPKLCHAWQRHSALGCAPEEHPRREAWGRSCLVVTYCGQASLVRSGKPRAALLAQTPLRHVTYGGLGGATTGAVEFTESPGGLATFEGQLASGRLTWHAGFCRLLLRVP